MGELIRRRLGLVIVVAAIVLFLSATRIATFLTDLWWFDGLGYRSVFTGILGTQLLLGVVFGVVMTIATAVTLHVARKIRPLFIPTTPQEVQVERLRQMADPYLKWVILGVALLLGLSAGGTAATQWERFLLWRNAEPFGIVDPQFNLDVGFYVFHLPWWQFVQGWLFTTLIVIALVTAASHVMLGGIRPDNPGDKVTPQVKLHLSVILVLILAARAWGWWLDRYALNFSPRGTVTGASFTDVNAELPALYLLLGVSVVSIVLVIVSARRRGFLLPGAAIALLLIASILLQGAYPAFIQNVRVAPQEGQREAPYIERNLEATRTAYGLADTVLRSFDVANDLDEQEIIDEETTINNVRLWDPQTLETTFSQLQAQRPYYKFREVDADRYLIDGRLRQIMISTRELDQAGLDASARSWQNERLTFTHGYGVVASLVNTANADGQPLMLAEDIPSAGVPELTLTVPGIYFGELLNPTYSVVDTDQPELDYETGSGQDQEFTAYDGEGGVSLGGRLRRLVFAMRFGDPNLVLSGLLRDDSKVLYRRDIGERVSAVAPYLKLDSDPYPVVLDGRIVWVQDAYTTSAYYPYSERTNEQPLFGTLNYIRNSVKAVVDAYDGSVELYVVDPTDPIIQAWQRAFPEPYRSLEDVPAGLAEHFRYPVDMFDIQAKMYRSYHIPGAQAFYNKADIWQIPIDAAQAQNTGTATSLRPYYLLMRLPGEEREEFVIIQPYQPGNKKIMNGWLAGRADGEHYGELFAVQFPIDQDVLGPEQAQGRIEQEADVSRFITLLDQAGSSVVRGNMQIIPIGNSILYVEPLFIQNEQAQLPELAAVVVVLGSRVVMADSLSEALAELVGAAVASGDDSDPSTDGSDTEDVAELLRRALEAFANADAALLEGNLGGYQASIRLGVILLERAATLAGVSIEDLVVPEPTPSDGAAAEDAPADDAPADDTAGDGTSGGGS